MPNNRSVLQFFLLSFGLILPFFLLDILVPKQILPGIPLAGIGTFCPMIAAVILSYRAKGKRGVAALLKRSFDFRQIKRKRWYAPILLILPAVTALSLWVMHITGVFIPHSQAAILPLLGLSVGFFVGDLGEELGWSGYAIEPLQARWGALRASLILGLVWAVYHYIGLLQVHRSIGWIAWWTLYTVAARLIMVWIFNNTGHSVFGMTLFHMMLNVTWQIYPVNGSSFDPRITGIILAIVAAIVALVWGSSPQGRRVRQPARQL